MALQSTTALAKITLQSSSPNVIFSEIPNIYKDLILVCNIKNSVQTELYLRFNGDAGASYNSVRMQGSGSTAGGNSQTNATGARLNGNGDIMTDFSFNAEIQIFDYSSANKHTSGLSRTNSSNGVDACSFHWAVNTPVNSITAYPNSGNFEAGSTLVLFGRIA